VLVGVRVTIEQVMLIIGLIFVLRRASLHLF
jgi:hypothetical protein